MNRGRSAGSGGASHAHQHQQNQQHGGYGNHHNQTHQNNPTTGGVGPAPTPHHHHHQQQQQQPQMMNNAYDYSYQLDDEFGGKDIDWSSIAVGGVGEAAATTTTTTATTATSITHQTNLNAKTQVPQAQAQQQQTTTAAAQPRVPAYNRYGTTSSSSGGCPGRQQYGHQQNQYSASSSVGLTDGAVVMSSGGSGGGGGGSSSASGNPGSAHGAGGGHAGGSASNAIDLTTDDNVHGQGQNGGRAGSGGNAQEEELRKKVRVSIWAVWFDELLPTAFLETSSSDPTAITPGTDLVAILEDGSDLVSGFPRRRTIKKKARYFKSRHRNRRANNYVMEMKSFALQIVLRLVDCCDDSRNRWLQGDPLCRRVLAAVLDELEGSILPVLDSVPTNSNRKLTEHPLSFCQVATAYTSLLCRSTDGFKLLRTQMISDFSRTAGGHRERLSFSGIAIMIDILRWTLNAPKPTNGELGRDLVALSQSIRDSIVDFFCLVWSQVTQIRLSEGEAESDTLLSVVDERREIFIGCFSEMQCPLTRTAVRENTLLAVEQIMREIGYDIDEE